MPFSSPRKLFAPPASRTIRASCKSRNTVSRRCNSSQAKQSNSTLEKNTLSWQEYLEIRGRKRRWEIAATLPSIFLGLGAGAAYFGGQEIDASKPIFGFDPLYVYGFATLSCGGIGYLFGPIIGSTVWRLTHRRSLALIEARDRQFHQHIVKNRVDPTAQSATNPVPDFYGEKIGSLRQYRQWLRDQARYKRKAKWLEEESL
ncbi:mitochondrial import protein Pam17 [Fomitiporia mediterranea MF3/22]|uniref:mitochondrial import protein Pam17 n=1 Tax=Fomitiporia mediterranea (strain MF3/22) TaxID=694068 RepID=UPI000440840E|nr:mitochondrial import protein Pam17 [Fomitiporia mediterranea MF3/22]EJD02152.1 mitochondrial import protein Pam17 [Fomitiporia mediterranea MF3/22]